MMRKVYFGRGVENREWGKANPHSLLPIPQSMRLHMGQQKKATRWWAIGFWCAVGAIRLGYPLLAPSLDPFLRQYPLHGDALVHDQIAWTLVSEGRYEYLKGLQVAPAYMWLMAGVYLLMGHEPQAVRLVNGLQGLLTLWGIWQIAWRWLGEKPAYWTVALCTLHPHLLMISGWLYTENLALPLLVWALVFALRANRGREAVWAGGLLGLLALTRANFLPFALLVALWCWGRYGYRPAVSILMATLLVVSPYIVYLYGRFGHFIPIGLGGYTFLWANNPEADGGFRADFLELRMEVGGQEVLVRDYIASPDPVERDRKALRLALEWIRQNPTDFLHLLWKKTRLTLSAFGLQEAGNRRLVRVLGRVDWLYWLFLLIALLGLVVGWRTSWREFSLPALLIGWVWLTIWLYAGGSRPLLPAMPFITLFFVRGIILLIYRAEKG